MASNKKAWHWQTHTATDQIDNMNLFIDAYAMLAFEMGHTFHREGRSLNEGPAEFHDMMVMETCNFVDDNKDTDWGLIDYQSVIELWSKETCANNKRKVGHIHIPHGKGNISSALANASLEQRDAMIEQMWIDIEAVPQSTDHHGPLNHKGRGIMEDIFVFDAGDYAYDIRKWFDHNYSKGLDALINETSDDTQ